MKYFISILWLIFSVASRANGGTAEPWSAAIYDVKDRLICSGALIASDRIVSSGHCFASKAQNHRYKVKLGSGEIRYAHMVESFDEDGRAFPNDDVARVILERAVEETTPIDFGSDVDVGRAGHSSPPMQAMGYGVDPNSRSYGEIATRQPTDLRFLRRLTGYRLQHLAEVNVVGGKRLCRGDSGGGVYITKNGKPVLIGIVSGRMDGVGDFSPHCGEGSDLITLISRYKPWLLGGERKHATFQKNTSINIITLEQVCRKAPPGSAAGIFIDELIQTYIASEKNKGGKNQDFSSFFLKCAPMHLISEAMEHDDFKVVMRGDLPATIFKILKNVKNLEMVDINPSLLLQVSQLKRLKRLTLTGLRWKTNLENLNTKTLESIVIRNSPCILGVEHLPPKDKIYLNDSKTSLMHENDSSLWKCGIK